MFLIQIGRLLMVCVWGFFFFGLFHTFPKPLNYFMHVAMIFMLVMHALLMLLYKAGQKDLKMSLLQQIRLFFFGVFELLAILRKNYKK